MNTRKDIVTNKVFDRNELIRIAIQKNGETLIDKNFSMGGRGIYILPTNIEIALEKKILERQVKRFKGNFSNIEKTLIMEVKNGKER